MGNIFVQLVAQPLLKSVVARIITACLKFPRNKFQCCKLKKFVAKSRARVYFAQHIAATCNIEICCVES